MCVYIDILCAARERIEAKNDLLLCVYGVLNIIVLSVIHRFFPHSFFFFVIRTFFLLLLAHLLSSIFLVLALWFHNSMHSIWKFHDFIFYACVHIYIYMVAKFHAS